MVEDSTLDIHNLAEVGNSLVEVEDNNIVVPGHQVPLDTAVDLESDLAASALEMLVPAFALEEFALEEFALAGDWGAGHMEHDELGIVKFEQQVPEVVCDDEGLPGSADLHFVDDSYAV